MTAQVICLNDYRARRAAREAATSSPHYWLFLRMEVDGGFSICPVPAPEGAKEKQVLLDDMRLGSWRCLHCPAAADAAQRLPWDWNDITRSLCMALAHFAAKGPSEELAALEILTARQNGKLEISRKTGT